jgi:hypothetical protein
MEFDKDILMKAEQRKNMLRQAEQYQLVKLALAARPQRAYFWSRQLHWLGHQLVEIGCFLLRQFDRQARTAVDMPRLYPCEEVS